MLHNVVKCLPYGANHGANYGADHGADYSSNCCYCNLAVYMVNHTVKNAIFGLLQPPFIVPTGQFLDLSPVSCR